MNRNGLDKLCRAWAGVTSDIKWGSELVYSVRGKMFLVCPDQQKIEACSFKVPDDLFLGITEQPGIVPSPEAARFKWVRVTEPARYGDAWLERHIRQSYRLVVAKLPKKTQRDLGLLQ